MFTAAFSCSETPASCFLQDPHFLLPALPPPPRSRPGGVRRSLDGASAPAPWRPRSHQVSAMQPRALGSNLGAHMVSVSQTPPKKFEGA